MSFHPPRRPSALIATLITLALTFCASVSSRTAKACAPAPAEGMRVSVHAEDALIIWDEARKRQHFIRRADFRQQREAEAAAKTGKSDFGFLVPTPTKPELAEAPDAVFQRLATHIRPRIERYNEYEVAWSLCGGMFLGAAEDSAKASADAPVEVLDKQRVAGFDAAVLKATDPDALADWLKNNGYAFRPALRDWLSTYVRQGWIVTAFKIAPTDGASPNPSERPRGVGSTAVRMSFDAEAPFFPYREPADQEEAQGRQLRVFFAGPTKVNATVGASATWGAQLLFADALKETGALFDGVLPADEVPAKLWLSAYLDEAAKRSSEGELMFAAAPGESFVRVERRSRTVTLPIFLDVLLFLALIGGGIFTLRKRASS